jgi:asparagine synthase (glutamine-hydrolysing)
VIEIGASGAQPMSDFSGRWMLTFNGEIYNYVQLRADLEADGCCFRTNSDSEVLINVVAYWGENGLKRLRGMYAFALWDDLAKELWLARDPFGIKPLYVSYQDNIIWFASQARALADRAPVDTRRDPAALTGFYLWGYVPEPFSWWAGVQMFPAGHVQRLSVGKAASAPECFYSVPMRFTIRSPEDNDFHPTLRDVLKDSVRYHLVADTPVGIFLSAGIDSNIIAALAGEERARLHTVTLAFKEYSGTSADEAPLAELAAKALKSEHVTVRVSRDDFDSHVDSFFASMDQPSIDGLNTYLVSYAAATQGLKVALSGLGGDEFFAGYPSFHQIPRLVAAARRVPARYQLGKLALALRRSIPRSISPKLAALIDYASDIGSAYLLRRSLYLIEELSELIDESWLRAGLERLATAKMIAEITDPLVKSRTPLRSQIAALEVCWYMRNQLLRDADWAGMAHGVEIRVPYVDTGVLEYLAPLMASNNPPNKIGLSRTVFLPKAMRARRKTGFTTPVRHWSSEESFRGLRGWANVVHRRLRTGSAEASMLIHSA